MVSVEANHPTSNDCQFFWAVAIHPLGGLSQTDVNRLVAETGARESERKSKREQEEVERELVGLVARTMRSVQALGVSSRPRSSRRSSTRSSGPRRRTAAAI